jgi:hypothetical protein
MGVVIVVSGHNNYFKQDPVTPPVSVNQGDSLDAIIPQRWAADGTLPNIIVVGATDMNTNVAAFAPNHAGMVWAHGSQVAVAISPNQYGLNSGCFFGK